ncbi:heavy metal translocating P-type ATPase metal-binding domain-containing protein [Telmatospirillum sp.]|uniref:heavy metal translocating P-type ATPase metal-binding domain-containing protein n=1 Tax=Telmatospirillum sp. TaxID=2079197 RepID=UPI00283C510B|nr:heavy metal translocating P-type ATPase metal-binding domain-containing protein [Telmatospirillum sp.]MDR3435230.1 heavy metal translocating P-type ATPase metal-binding domain-containing protein [Telmatospirillum sp.]
MAVCAHCGAEVGVASTGGAEFCCRGCRAAYSLVRGMGLDQYYRRRSIDPTQRPLRPDDEAGPVDYSAQVHPSDDGIVGLHLMVEGMHCAACVWLIESILARQPGVIEARLNMTTRRLVVRWRDGETNANAVLAPVIAIGYRLQPYDPARLGRESERVEKELLRAMAVAGFAAGNVMLFSVSIWAGQSGSMDWVTRSLFHWISALIALPAVVYCIRPFARSAFSALRAGRSNMDVPITIGVTLASAMSLWETMRGGPHAYFDAAISLLFFLLIGRYLDSRARGRARSSAEHLLALGAVTVTVLDGDGTRRLLPPEQVQLGMTVLVATGERIGADGTVTDGQSEIDTSLITGETVPAPVEPGATVFAGTLNLSGPLKLEVTAVGESTLLAEIVRMMEVAEQGRARYVAIADRVARYYAPVVHLMGLVTFLGWEIFTDTPWQVALLYAVSVLIITCPCALALAVPVVQVVASGRWLRRGILAKSATAQERLASVDWVVFDKTGTLTEGRPELQAGHWTQEDLRQAASIAAASKHPVARAVARAMPDVPVADDVREVAGCGLAYGDIRLGSRQWLGLPDDPAEASGPELFLARPGHPAVRFGFRDPLRADAKDVVALLKHKGYRLTLLSGDRRSVVETIAGDLGIDDWQAGCKPADKCARLAALAGAGHKVLMIGDGLNDAPALASAHVSMSPSSAVDISQTVADVVFQGHLLSPVIEALAVARKAGALVRQNFALALGYNLLTIPLAIAGQVTPLIAAISMSTSSVIVISNALRLSRGRLW